MRSYLDSAVIVYRVEKVPVFHARAAALLPTVSQIVGTDLNRLECRDHPLRFRDQKRLDEFDRFFAAVSMRDFSRPTFDEATRIRAVHGYQTADALHLAMALESGCRQFITNDLRLKSSAELQVVLI